MPRICFNPLMFAQNQNCSVKSDTRNRYETQKRAKNK